MGDGAKKSKFAQRYFWLLQGTIIQAHVTWLEAGLIGLGMYVLYWLSVFRVFRRRLSRNLQLQWMLGFMVLIFSVYNAPFFVIPFIIIFLFLVYISSRWGEMPPYRYIKLLGSRPIRFSMSDDEESRAPEAATDR